VGDLSGHTCSRRSPAKELTAHFEAEPAEHPREHVDHVGIDVPRGNGVLRQLLDEAGVDDELSSDWTETRPTDDDGAAEPWLGDEPGVDVEVE
jgi:hypothetical protein